MALREFKLPDPGEGLTEAEIVTWHVAPGDTVEVNDVVVEIETAKSLVELPVPFAGTVGQLLVAEGDTVEVGTPIVTVDDGVAGEPDASSATGASPAAGGSQPDEPGASESAEASSGRTAVLVGYGVKQTEAVRRPRRPVPDSTNRSPEVRSGVPDSTNRSPEVRSGVPDSTNRSPEVRAGVPDSTNRSPEGRREDGPVRAKPPVRKLAKDLGVDLSTVAPSGPGGVVTRADVEEAAGAPVPADAGAPSAPGPAGASVAPHPTRVPGGETRVPVKGVRRMTAQAMVESAFTAPHVTEWVTVDVTATMELVERLKADREFRDAKVTPLLVLAKAMCVALRRHPEVNASWDDAAQEIVYKHDVNLGIAAATPRGLVVPNVKGADRMTMRELADAVAELTATAREGRTQPADMAGGTITVTNVGVFGVDAGTPILNPGEAAILAFGAVSRRPWVLGTGAEERIEPRWVTTLALSFDHRLVDGELGSRYLADVAALLHDPARGLVWG
ncbi:2-oxo acid dehydrogenase subunit E2 [Phycicoccus endophyticus]|uniref:Dihydrolipoamide acetyltransferase component of pyruvate dehydrogenase complex n=1 Tax=Phycicoccus endophyticus TaxID=1690220 RepID=A0A7G9R1E4_9MICO|nr:dihydrolipoamide acetyltransferase family protein [Phycicoccus endophyticus]NHI18795.1 2-oxo acid dehydrogenase subunit E2 [Phycicoccus endophyticus]QNN49419.1 2-oxo acid dehydrogenase subunit E2 [Phycicoccus endophyticus]GGL36512.1 dihydrolipoamide acetyltransferase component of pyruvate dehydrogenase complex [Phycicoccus endophyticus]